MQIWRVVAIYLYNIPIRHITPAFFVNLSHFENASMVEFSLDNCIEHDSSTLKDHDLTTFEWKSERCFNRTAGDLVAFQTMLMKMHKSNSINGEEYLFDKFDTATNEIIKMFNFKLWSCYLGLIHLRWIIKNSLKIVSMPWKIKLFWLGSKVTDYQKITMICKMEILSLQKKTLIG